MGGLNPSGEFFSLGHLEQSIGHALVGGVTSEIQGEDWTSGALAAGLSAVFAPGIDRIGGGAKGEHYEYEAMRVAASAAVGGTAAELGGGKFANGAVTAAFMRLCNEEIHIRYPTAAHAGQNDELLGDAWQVNAMSRRQWVAWTLKTGVDPDSLLGDFYGPPGRLHEQCCANCQSLTGAPSPAHERLYGGAYLSDLDPADPALKRGLVVAYGFDARTDTYLSNPTGNHVAYVVSDGVHLTFYNVFAGQRMTNSIGIVGNYYDYRVLITPFRR